MFMLLLWLFIYQWFFFSYFSFQAIKEYQKALEVLKSRKKCPDIWDLVVWEFSTTLYTIASLLQDHPPLESKVGNIWNELLHKITLSASASVFVM